MSFLPSQARADELLSLEAQGRQTVWWPFTQHKSAGAVTVIDSAYGDDFVTLNKGKVMQKAWF
jgi:hypothetical protein